MLGISEEPSSQGAGPMGETLWRYHLCLDLTPLSSIYSRLADTSAKKSDNWRILVGVEW
jgi:hypothetical protein